MKTEGVNDALICHESKLRIVTKNGVIRFVTAILFLSFSLTLNGQDNDNMLLGNPSNATSDTLNQDNYFMGRPQYCLSYNNSRHIPNWVSWHVCITDLGITKRKNRFRSDETLPVNWYHVSNKDYYKSGFDKGHCCPSGDRTLSEEDNSATFFLTNMIPQNAGNNRVTWEQFESYCRKLVKQGDELYISTGSIGQGGEGANGNASFIGNDVVVPAEIWKIVVVLPDGDEDLKRVNATTRVIAVLMPNNQSCSEKKWTEYRVSVDKLQSLTGYDFFSRVPKKIQKTIEVKIDDE